MTPARPALPVRIGSRCSCATRSASSKAVHGPLGQQRPIKAAYYRGGTSRALLFQPSDLPRDRTKWPALFRQLMGSPDPYGRQLDGMGAGISSLSKICLVERMRKERLAAEDSVQVDYTFVGVGIENDEVDVAGNCGNMSSAIGPYAYNAGLLAKSVYARGDGHVTVKIRNTNTQKYIDSTFAVVGGQAAVQGDYAIDGVAGTASKVKLDFRDPYGSKTGSVLPTGRKVDAIAGYKVTCVDGANPCIFIRADEIGIDGTILPNDFNKRPDKLSLLENIRKAAAVAMGVAKTEDEVPRTIPKIGIISMSSTHEVLSGLTLKSSQVDIVVRFISDTQPHRAIPLTAALTTAVAARIPGTVVEQLLAPDPVDENVITIGHASGKIQVNATMDEKNKLKPVSASVYRTARRIFEGDVYWMDGSEPDEDVKSERIQTHSLGLAFVEESRGLDSSYLEDTPEEQDELDEGVSENVLNIRRVPSDLVQEHFKPTQLEVTRSNRSRNRQAHPRQQTRKQQKTESLQQRRKHAESLQKKLPGYMIHDKPEQPLATLTEAEHDTTTRLSRDQKNIQYWRNKKALDIEAIQKRLEQEWTRNRELVNALRTLAGGLQRDPTSLSLPTSATSSSPPPKIDIGQEANDLTNVQPRITYSHKLGKEAEDHESRLRRKGIRADKAQHLRRKRRRTQKLMESQYSSGNEARRGEEGYDEQLQRKTSETIAYRLEETQLPVRDNTGTTAVDKDVGVGGAGKYFRNW